MANNTTKKAGSNKSFIDRMGGQKFIVLLVVIALFIFFCAMSPNFRKYTTFINILDFSYYIVLMAIGVAFPLMTGGVDLSIGTGLVTRWWISDRSQRNAYNRWYPCSNYSWNADWCSEWCTGSNHGPAGIPGNTLYLYDYSWTWFHYRRWIRNLMAGSSSTGRMVQKYLQDSVWRTEYPDRFLMGNSSGCCYDICTESYKNWTLYTCNRK